MHSNSNSATESSTESTDTAAATSAKRKARKAEIAEEKLRRQVDSTPAAHRNVVKTLGAQLILAITKIRVKKGECNELLQKLRQNLHPFWFDRSKEDLTALR